MKNQEPYLKVETVVTTLTYNPEYGDNRLCQCGDMYYRHFDTYENMLAVGCKYCDCFYFIEANSESQPSKES